MKASKNTIDSLFKKACPPPQKQSELTAPARSCIDTSDNTAATEKTAPRYTQAVQVKDRDKSENPAQHRQAAPSNTTADRPSDKAGAQDQSADAEKRGSVGEGDRVKSNHQRSASLKKATEAGREEVTAEPQNREGPRNDAWPVAPINSSSEEDFAFSSEEARGRIRNAEAKQIETSSSNLCADGSAEEKASFRDKEPSQGQETSPWQDQDGVEVGGRNAIEETSKEEANEGLDTSLQGIDMREQKRIMHEIWVRNNLRQSDRSPKKQARKQSHSTSSNVAKQPRLTDRFLKRA